jgi:hypothetical protein
MSARPDTIEHIVLEIDQPQTIARLVYEVEEELRERTQEYALKSRRTEAERIGKFWFRHTPSAPEEPRINAKTSALISTG